MVNGITILLKSKKYYLHRYKYIPITQNVQLVLKKYTSLLSDYRYHKLNFFQQIFLFQLILLTFTS